MTTSSVASEKNGYRKFVGWVLTVIGIVMIVAGTSAWFAVGAQIKSQDLTVPGDATSNAGKAVAGPITAWSMQETIQMHADHSTDGQTYAELGTVVNEAKEQYGEDSDEAAAAQALRNTQMNASFLRASLFTSILAYGVSLLVVGTGVSVLLAGTVFLQKRRDEVVKVEIANQVE